MNAPLPPADIVEKYMPIAQKLAKRTAYKYHNSIYAAEIDEDACLSAALEGLEEVARPGVLCLTNKAEEIEGFCATAISRRLIDLERHVLRRRSHKTHDTTSLEALIHHANGEEGDVSCLVPTYNSPEKALQIREECAHLKERLRCVLGKEEYKVACDTLDYAPQGFSTAEIAEKTGKNAFTYKSILSHVRKKLRTDFPEIEQEFAQRLGDDRERSFRHR